MTFATIKSTCHLSAYCIDNMYSVIWYEDTRYKQVHIFESFHSLTYDRVLAQLSSVLRAQQYLKLDQVFCLLDEIWRASATLLYHNLQLLASSYMYYTQLHIKIYKSPIHPNLTESPRLMSLYYNCVNTNNKYYILP